MEPLNETWQKLQKKSAVMSFKNGSSKHVIQMLKSAKLPRDDHDIPVTKHNEDT